MLQAKNSSTRLQISLGHYSAAGRKPENQDFCGALIPTGTALSLKGIALAVADGISSSATSAAAAETAVKALMQDYYATPQAWTVKTSASRVISATNAWLYGNNRSLSNIDSGQVCTLSALILKGRTGHVFHVGDSRVQRLAGQSLEPLTEDHRVSMGPEENYLARALGTERNVEIDYRCIPLAEGDIFLLTTDGVHDHIDGPIVHAALQCPTLDAAARYLADIALERGSDDNLTVQIARIDTLPSGPMPIEERDDPLPVPPIPKAGDLIDDFRILRPLHQSARSHVFLAAAPGGRQAVLKIPASDITGEDKLLRRFMLEEWIARQIRSPHVVREADYQSPRTALYVATEYVDGRTLRQWMIDNPKPDLNQVRDIIEQIAAGLRALHRREMIHQDLRPENVMIDTSGTVKIVDLGSTAVAGVEEAQSGLLGDMPGTFQYTAPEYLSGDVVSWRSDQYALAVIAYEMLTGRLPYGSQVARIRTRRDQARLAYRSARDDDSTLPFWMDAALRKAAHPDPLRRYDALSEFVSDLKQPGIAWRNGRHLPLAARDPVRFWQAISAVLAVICLYLLIRLGS